MQHGRTLRQSLLLGLTLLSACAAAGPAPGADGAQAAAFSAVLTGTFAAGQGDTATAAEDFLHALAADPHNPDLLNEAFLACVVAGRPEAAGIAQQLPGNPIAQMLLADLDARAGNWDSAQQRFASLPKQGITELLGPLLVAWAQQGAGNTDAALATLRPFVDGGRYRGIYGLHAGLIADLGGRTVDADRLYHIAETNYGGLNLRLGQVLASWEARQNHPAEAQHTIDAMLATSPELAIAGPALKAADAVRPVPTAADGIAEAYLALAAALQLQDANDFALLLLHLAIDLRPDFTAARLLTADIQSSQRHPQQALATLAGVPASDPLSPVVRMRRALLQEQLGQTEAAMRELDRLAHDFPDRAEPLEIEGDTLRLKQRFPEAAAVYDRAIARLARPGRDNWRLFYDRGIAYERSHEWDRAEADFNRALAVAPDQPDVLNYLGYSWADQGRNLARARLMIEKAVQQRPNDGSIIDSLGWVMLRQGDHAEAIRTLERAVELEPEDPTINGHLGDAYWSVGRRREAEFQWRRALTLHPEADESARLEAKLHDAPGATAPQNAATQPTARRIQ
jgi:tetratricopeptide (TPR) repeat protein